MPKTLQSLALSLLGLPLMLSAQPTPAAQAGSEVLSFDQIFAENRPGSWPKQIAWHPDGDRLSYLLPDAEGTLTLWSFAAETGQPQALISAKDLPEAKLDSYQWSPKGDRLLVTSGDNYLLWDPSTRALKPLPGLGKVEQGPTFSPDGSRLAYSRDANLWVLDLASGKEKALTRDGKKDSVLNGVCDWIYWEEIWNRHPAAFWWSPDGKRLAYYRFDEAGVETYALTDYQPLYPAVRWQKYPKAGRANPKVEIRVADVASGKSVKVDTGTVPDAYLARIYWLPQGDRLAIERLNREQNHLDLLVCDTQKGRCAIPVTESYPTWINLSDDNQFLKDGNLLWSSEQTGFRHLSLLGPDGKLVRQLTAGNWAVTSVDAVDEASGWVYFTGFSSPASGGIHRRVYRVKIDGTQSQPITPEHGWNEALVAPGARYWLHTASSASQVPKRTVVRADGTRLSSLPTGPEPAFSASMLPSWEFLTLWGLDGTRLPARILRPVPFDANKRYPVIVYHYGGPGSQVVVNRWEGNSRDLWHRMMAQRGYVVLSVDNATTACFGKKGEDQVHRAFGSFNTDAQLAAVEFLKTQTYVDPDRIGLWGWSGGGSNTLMALLTRPGVWKAAVAGAPVTDWHLYDSIWTERYLDSPDGNPDGYKASSPITYAKNLKDHLLLVHGTADDNVHPQNTLNLSQALIEEGIPFEEAIYPGSTHAIAGKNERHFYQRMTEFFDRWLKP